jgi:hypothetical protein
MSKILKLHRLRLHNQDLIRQLKHTQGQETAEMIISFTFFTTERSIIVIK